MPTRKHYSFKNKQLSYQTFGNGPILMLVHGFAEDGNIWENQFDAFPGYQLVIPDLPGSGESEMIEDMTMEGMAETLKFLLEQELKEDFLILIGHSMGGYITLAFVDKYPGVVKSFGLFHSSAFADNEEKIATRKKGIEFIIKNGAMEFLNTSIPNLYAPKTKEERSALIEQHKRASERFTKAALIAYYESMIERPDRTNVLKNTNVPVLFILGRYDTAIPIQDGLKQVHMPKQAFVYLLENSGHMGMIEEVEKVNSLLNEYLVNLSQ